MPLYQLLTDRTLAESSAITPTTLIHIVTTGDTSQNSAGSSFKAELGQLAGLFSGGSVSGDYLPLSGGTVSGATNFTNGLTANTISATTYLNLPQFSGGSGNCITDLYTTNIHSCSPLNINPLDEGEVYFGSTSGITIDVTNSRLGIGTSNPQYPLQVFSGSSQLYYDPTSVGGRLLLSGSTNIPRLDVGISPYLLKPNAGISVGLRAWNDTSYPGYGKVGDGHVYAGSATNGLNLISVQGTGTEDYIRFYAGQEALPANIPDIHIQGTGTTRGYVGIGTNTPTELLHLKSAGAARIRIDADTDDTPEPDNAEILMSQDGGNTKANISLTPDTNNDLMIGVNAGAGTTPDIRFNTNSDGLTFTTSADTKVIIKNDGKVGIGINDPQYFLQVFSGSSQLFYNPTSSGGVLVVSGSTNLPRYAVNIPAFSGKLAASATFGIRAWNDISLSSYGKVGDTHLYSSVESNGLNIVSAPGSGTEDYIRFFAGNVANTTPDIYVQGSGFTRGYVGIGTDTPSEKLDVSGKTKTTNFQMTSGAANGYVLTSDVSGNASWQIPTGGGGTFTGGTVSGATNFTGGLTANTFSATTYLNLPVTADTFTTAFTYSNNVFTISRNQGLSSLTATISTVTGFTVNGDLTITGNTNIGGGLTATTISATTYLNLPVPPFFNPGTASTINWDVSGVSNNYTATLTATTTTLNVSNIRNGEYATIILTQNSSGSRAITLGTINGTSGSGRHKVSSGGGGLIYLTSNPNAVDILSCVYDGNILYWTVGNDYN